MGLTKCTRCARLCCALLGLLLGPSACGKPATEADCEKIVTRVTELELKASNVSDPQQVQAQINEAQRSFKARALKDCVGRRLSQKTLRCVEDAKEARQITEECF
jgi:hypothetical protein